MRYRSIIVIIVDMAKFFTKKITLILLTVILAVSGIIWAVVANIDPKFNAGIDTVPAGNYVSGNGTASVLVDDYLYFVGDSITTKEIKYGDNEYFADGKMMDTGIYRVRMVDGQPVLNYEYDNNSTNDDGEKIVLQPGDEGYNTKVVAVNDWDNVGDKGNGIEAVVPKIAGHDQSAMWVFGKHLIYVSPHNRYDNRGNLLSNYLDFFRVDLDGKNHTLVYTTESADLTTDNFTVWADATENVYVLVHETANNEIKKINVNDKKVTVLDTKVADVVLPKATQYSNNTNETLDKVYGGVMSYVYYTKVRTDVNENDSNKGNLLYRCGIEASEPELIAQEGSAESGTTFKPLAVTPLQNGNAQFVFSVVKQAGSEPVSPILCLIDNNNLQDYHYEAPADAWGLKNADTVRIYANGFCTINNKLRHYTIDGTNMILDEDELISNTVDKVLAVMENTVYVQSGTTVWKATLGKSATSVTVVPNTTVEDTENTENTEETETPEHTITLPIAILNQPHDNTGDPMIFVQDASHIRLYDANGKVTYLRFKEV